MLIVALGRLQRVQRLLQMGADPSLRGGSGDSMVHVALEMGTVHPEDDDWQRILQLVLNGAAPTAGGGSDGARCGVRSSQAMDNNGMISRLLREVTSLRREQSERLTSLSKVVMQFKGEIASLKVTMETLKVDIISQKESLNDLHVKMKSINGEQESLKESSQEIIQHVSRNNQIDDNNDSCVRATMAKTQILSVSEEKISPVSGYYDMLLVLSRMTSCLVRYLSFRPDVKIRFHFDSEDIGNMKRRLKDYEGIERSGNYFNSFADFEARTVYIGGDHPQQLVPTSLALRLTQMAVFLAFDN